MNRDTWPVTSAHGPRPAGRPDECFYCFGPVGAEHHADCVLRKKTVVLRVSVEYVVEVPESWGAKEIEFQRNEGSFCMNNDVRAVLDTYKQAGCWCGPCEVVYVRNATEEDHERLTTPHRRADFLRLGGK